MLRSFLTLSWVLLWAVSSVAAQEATEGVPADVVRQWASRAAATSQYDLLNWSADQATGEPDTFRCGDIPTAWASRSANTRDTLTLYYDQPVIPTEINIVQTYNPGAIRSVGLIAAETGEQIVLDDSADPGTQCPGIFSLSLAERDDLPAVSGVVLVVDQTETQVWNEIDAVELVGVPADVTPPPPTYTISAQVSGAATMSADELPDDAVAQWAASASATSQGGSTARSVQQATGEPDTAACGNAPSAWASSKPTAVDALALVYAVPVIPAHINIYQTFTPGSITGIELIPADGSPTIVVPQTADPGTPCPGVMQVRLDIEGEMPAINGIIIRLDQRLGGTWNQIDAVELVGVPG